MLKCYLQLIKPGILFGNLITMTAGFFLASCGHPSSSIYLGAFLGLTCIMASACAFNHYVDRHIDEKMPRTKNRPLVQGTLSVRHALTFATVLVTVGCMLLYAYTNTLALLTALLGFIFYVVIYGYSKQRTEYGTVIGSIAGAVPPVVGYVAVTNCIDAGAYILFLIVALWQMPHFFAIAMYHAEEYAAASIPVLPVVRGNQTTKVQMLYYVLAFIVATLLLPLFGYAGHLYSFIATVLGSAWLLICLQGFSCSDDRAWAKKMFVSSLVIVMALSLTISLSSYIQ